MPKKIDPLNKKMYGAVSAMLTVTDIKAAAGFYQKAFGFQKRGIMNGPDGKPMHCELRLRDATVMLGPEYGPDKKSAKSMGGSPVTMYVLVDSVDKTFAKAVKLGATATMPPMDMFWGDRCASLIDPEGHSWWLGTHVAEPTPAEMKKKMKEQMAAMSSAAAGA